MRALVFGATGVIRRTVAARAGSLGGSREVVACRPQRRWSYFEDLLLSPEPGGLEALLPAPAEVGGLELGSRLIS